MNNILVIDELDQAIDLMFAGKEAKPFGQHVAQLMEIAAELIHIPRTDFKTRLRLELEWQASGRLMSKAAPSASGEGWPFGKRASTYPIRPLSFAASVAVHAGMAMVVAIGLWMAGSAPQVSTSRIAGVMSVTPYLSAPVKSKGPSGGGGGDVDKFRASKGGLPRITNDQITPPTVIMRNHRPILQAEPSVVADLNMPRSNQVGDPLSSLMTPSNGVGVGGGIGSGDGGGIGSGHGGPGVGPGVFTAGGSVTAPRAIYSPEPEFSDEARKAKYQGIVTLSAVIGVDGRARDLRLLRTLGMGLDQKAIDAVKTWRFKPGMKDGQPVPVQIDIEVVFNLY